MAKHHVYEQRASKQLQQNTRNEQKTSESSKHFAVLSVHFTTAKWHKWQMECAFAVWHITIRGRVETRCCSLLSGIYPNGVDNMVRAEGFVQMPIIRRVCASRFICPVLSWSTLFWRLGIIVSALAIHKICIYERQWCVCCCSSNRNVHWYIRYWVRQEMGRIYVV